MNTRKSSIHLFFFLLSFSLFLLMPLFLKTNVLYPFAPFLAVAFQRNSLVASLVIGTICGLSNDFFCTDVHFGVFTMIYALSTLCTYPLCSHLFEEKVFTIPLYTLFISWNLSLFFFLYLLLCNILTLSSLISLFFLCPLFSSLCALLLYSLPIYMKRRLYAYH